MSLISEAFMIYVFNQPCMCYELLMDVFTVLPTAVVSWDFIYIQYFHALKGGGSWYELLKGRSASHNFWGQM